MRAGGARPWAIAVVAAAAATAAACGSYILREQHAGRSGISPGFGTGPGCGPRGTTPSAGPRREIFTASPGPNGPFAKHRCRRGRSRSVFETQVSFYHPADGDTITDEDKSPRDEGSRVQRCDGGELKRRGRARAVQNFRVLPRPSDDDTSVRLRLKPETRSQTFTCARLNFDGAIVSLVVSWLGGIQYFFRIANYDIFSFIWELKIGRQQSLMDANG